MNHKLKIILDAKRQNRRLKTKFAWGARKLFGNFPIPELNSIEDTPWFYYMKTYLDMAKADPGVIYPTLDKVIEHLNPNSIWTADKRNFYTLDDIYNQAFDFIIKSQDVVDETREMAKKERKPMFILKQEYENGIQASYCEHFAIPCHGNVVIHTDNDQAAFQMTDALWMWPAEDGLPQQTYAIKLVQKYNQATDYMQQMIKNNQVYCF